MLRDRTTWADIRLKVKELGGVWRTRGELSVPASQGWNDERYEFPLIIPPSSKIRLDVVAGSQNNTVAAEFRGEYYRIIE